VTSTLEQQNPFERSYLTARYVVGATLVGFTAVGVEYYPEHVTRTVSLLGTFIFIVATVGLLIARVTLRTSIETVVLWVAPLDLMAIGLIGVGFHEFEDPVYALLLAMPILYAFLLRRRDIWILGVAAAAVYLLSHGPYVMAVDPLTYATLAAKAGVIILISWVVGAGEAAQLKRESQISHGTLEKERLNTQLQQRLSELQAVSQITEIIHSSLDFDRVGPLVLEVLTKVLDVPACCLFVIDKSKADTLFSASVGMASTTLPMPAGAAPSDITIGDTHFSCLSVLDHHQMMVVFCADSSVIDALSDEDQLVLQAVSSELVVAVENSQLYKLTKRLAITDELTDLYNYRYLQQRLDEEIERAKRFHKDFSLLMIDADDFKRFNDTQGHIAGDVALADLGRVVRSVVREVDVVCRYGGEEFSVMLPETDAAGAYVAAEKIREAIANYQFADADGARNACLTVSLGLATFPTHAPDKESLLRAADDALYQAKGTGKNRVRSPHTQRSTTVIEGKSIL